MAEDWSDMENELIVADYFSMLQDEIAGKAYNKTEHRKQLAPLLNHRSDGSIEFKHQNISAVLARFDIPWISGYKPRWNYQKKSLEEKVSAYIRINSGIEKAFNAFADTTVIGPRALEELSFSNLIEPPPASNLIEEPSESFGSRPVKRNYLKLEQNNKILGDSGEEVAFKYEKWRLIDAGRQSLADSVEWVSQTQGDGLGFDILSKNNNGTDRYIEVKTTKLSKEAPIFFTRNEYLFSKKNFSDFYLYRLFNFDKAPRAFILNGRFEDFCRFEAVSYQGRFC